MKDRTRFLLYALIFVFFLGIVAGLVSAWAYEKKGLVLVLTALISGAIVMFLALYNYQPLRTERDRERALLKRVQDSWVESLSELQRFAPGASLIDLEYRRPMDPAGGVQTLQISRVFEDAQRSLIILGGEGSGKTVSVLMLTKHLVKRALRLSGEPVPVVLSLSSWNEQTYNLFESWLVDELKLKYGLSETVALNWLIGRRLVLILDGLDEVDERDACVRALDSFVKDFNPPGIVVSSRIKKKQALLTLQEIMDSLPVLTDTIEIADLSENQIRNYSRGSEAILAYPEDSNVGKLARAPLALTLMLVTGNRHLGNDTREALLDAFISKQLSLADRMHLRDKPEKIRQRLRWLAQGMDKHRQAIFYIEGLQPSWLPGELGYVLLSRLLATLTVMMLGYLTIKTTNRGLGYLLGVKESEKISFGLHFVTENPLDWLFITIIFGGLGMGLIDYWRFKRSEQLNLVTRVRATLTERGDFKNLVANIALCWPIFFLGAVLMRYSWPKFRPGSSFFGFDYHTAFSGATIYAISFGLVFWFRGVGRSPRSDIRTAEKVTFTGSSLLRGAVLGTVAGAFLGFFPTLLVAYKYGWWSGKDGWVSAIQFWPISALIGLIVGGVTNGFGKVSVIEKSYPNQGVRLSLRNTVLIWLVVGGASSVAIWVYAILATGDRGVSLHDALVTLQDALLWGSVVGMLVGFGYGGLDVVYHVALRLLLFFPNRVAPLIKLRHFLDNVAYLGFLRKVGGGYMFLHGSLRKQFLEEYKEPNAATASSAQS